MTDMASRNKVKRRHVFFLSGFDPKGAAYYHRLYREQAAQQGALSGVQYEVTERSVADNGNAVWTIRAGGTETTYEYVRWDDIVRAQWPRGAWQVLVSSLQVYALVFAEPRALSKIWRVAPRTLVALFYPFLFWLGVGAMALLMLSILLGALAGLLGVVTAGAAACAVLAVGWQIEKHLHTSWLLRIFRFADRCASGQVPELNARADVLAEQINQALLRAELDEVLVVGFSVGSMVAVAAAARTVRLCESTQGLAKLSVLTLGHCIPLFALMPAAQALRNELSVVGHQREIFWVDCSAPSDWGSFALVDPVSLCTSPINQGINPRAMTSPRFHTLFAPEVYAKLKKNKRRMHMQYLMAGDMIGSYDYFNLTAGGMSLRQHCPQEAVG